MKKITLVLSAVLGLSLSGMAQATYNHVAPPITPGGSAYRAPNGTQDHAYIRSLYYIHPYEMVPMNLAAINTMSFQLASGASMPVTGNYTLWLSNDTDMQYAMGGSFSAATALMQQVYVGPYTIPATSGPTTIAVPVNNFTFTGSGLYVAYDFVSTGPFTPTASAAVYSTNSIFDSGYDLEQFNWLGNASASVSPVSNSFVGSFYRPSIIFGATNLITTQEAEVFHIDIDGVTSAFLAATQDISARVCNSGLSALTNLSVALNVSGANAHTDVVVIPNLAAGASQTISFGNFAPTNLGVNSMSVGVLLLDQIPTNNIKTWSQTVTCQNVGNAPTTFSQTNQYGYGADVHVANFHKFANTQTVTGVSVRIGSLTQNNGKQMSAVLIDNTGAVVANGALTNLTAGSTIVFPFNTPQVVAANSDYYIGVFCPSNSVQYYPFAYSENTVVIARPQYVRVASSTGVPPAVHMFGYFDIEPVLEVAQLKVKATVDKSIVCKGANVTLSVSAQPGLTYTWTTNTPNNPTNLNGAVHTVTLTPPGSQTTALIYYSAIGTHSSGCATSPAIVSVSVSICTGIDGDLADYRNLNMFPNPAANGITELHGLQGNNTIEATNIIGQVVFRKNTARDTETLDFSDLPKGQYLVKITNDKQQIRVFKVLSN